MLPAGKSTATSSSNSKAEKGGIKKGFLAPKAKPKAAAAAQKNDSDSDDEPPPLVFCSSDDEQPSVLPHTHMYPAESSKAESASKKGGKQPAASSAPPAQQGSKAAKPAAAKKDTVKKSAQPAQGGSRHSQDDLAREFEQFAARARCLIIIFAVWRIDETMVAGLLFVRASRAWHRSFSASSILGVMVAIRVALDNAPSSNHALLIQSGSDSLQGQLF